MVLIGIQYYNVTFELKTSNENDYRITVHNYTHLWIFRMNWAGLSLASGRFQVP